MRQLVTLCAASLLVACGEAMPVNENSSLAGFVCEDGKYFRLELQGRRAHVTTAAGSYLLRQASSPRGQAYVSEDVLLLIEDDVAQVRGLPEGLFMNCRQMRLRRGPSP
jgi:hypothetical protein